MIRDDRVRVGRVGRQRRGRPVMATGADQLVPSPVLTWSEPSTIMHDGPDGAGDGGQHRGGDRPVAGAGKYTEGSDQTAPSHDTVTPAPVVSSASPPLVPPPAATQNVSEMHDSEVKPPPGGSEVRAAVQPGGGVTGAGTVVGVAEGARLVVVGGHGRGRVAAGRGAGGPRSGWPMTAHEHPHDHEGQDGCRGPTLPAASTTSAHLSVARPTRQRNGCDPDQGTKPAVQARPDAGPPGVD